MANENQNIIGAGQDTARRAPKTNTIYCESCLETMSRMPDGFVDLIITSPPYNLNKMASGGGSSKRNYSGWYPDDMPEKEYQEWQSQVVSECLRVSKNGLFYNHRIRYAWHSRNKYRTPSNIYHPMDWLNVFPIWCEIIWDRGGTTGHANGRCRLADERIYHIGKPSKFRDCGFTTVWRITPSKNTKHVCSFPDELVQRCLSMCAEPGDVIYDPFAGSGTTCVVAQKNGMRFIGSEISDEYCRGIEERTSCAQESPAQNTMEICHTAPNSASIQVALDSE